jgi:hypothetical protein
VHLLYPAHRSFVSSINNGKGIIDQLLRLKPIDVEFMKRLHTKVNLIPVIAKSDTLTDDEVILFKRRVRFVWIARLF